jgi:hypothetical protein
VTKPTTRTSTTGSLNAVSASIVWTSRRRRVEPRSSPKTAAESVDASMDPSRSPSSGENWKSSTAATPVTTATTIVPTIASRSAVPSTFLICEIPAFRPPSKRIKARATRPSSRASS